MTLLPDSISKLVLSTHFLRWSGTFTNRSEASVAGISFIDQRKASSSVRKHLPQINVGHLALLLHQQSAASLT